MNHMKRSFYFVLTLLCFPFFSITANDVAPVNDKFVVVLDAGHGGKDPGNLGNGYMEKKIALKIVLQIGAILEKDPNIKVVYTRKTDHFVPLIERGKIANEAKADLFVSVHCDSHNSNAHGAGTFVLGLHGNQRNFEVAKSENESIYFEDDYQTKYAKYNINSPESIIGLTLMQEEFLSQSIDVAKRIQDNFTDRLKRVDRKVKQAGFVVLHQTFMPSVLVEAGFLTNKKEGAYLNSANGQKAIAKAIADAIVSYKNTYLGDSINSVENNDISKPVNNKPVNTTTTVKDNKEADNTSKESVRKKKVTYTPKKKVAMVQDLKKEVPKKHTVNTSYVFKVQLLASSKNIPLVPANFKSLRKISKEKHNNLYRYFYGSTNSYDQARANQKVAIAKGYKDCFVVAFKGGAKIPLSQAISAISQ